MAYLLRLFSLILILTCGRNLAGEIPYPIEGVYHLHNGYQSETLELRDGHFRYWFWTDAGVRRGHLPLEGTYSVNDSTLILNRDDILLEIGGYFTLSRGWTLFGGRKPSNFGLVKERLTGMGS
jgi:hypothetical protein